MVLVLVAAQNARRIFVPYARICGVAAATGEDGLIDCMKSARGSWKGKVGRDVSGGVGDRDGGDCYSLGLSLSG